jgi:hypothetical protein
VYHEVHVFAGGHNGFAVAKIDASSLNPRTRQVLERGALPPDRANLPTLIGK